MRTWAESWLMNDFHRSLCISLMWSVIAWRQLRATQVHGQTWLMSDSFYLNQINNNKCSQIPWSAWRTHTRSHGRRLAATRTSSPKTRTIGKRREGEKSWSVETKEIQPFSRRCDLEICLLLLLFEYCKFHSSFLAHSLSLSSLPQALLANSRSVVTTSGKNRKSDGKRTARQTRHLNRWEPFKRKILNK